jgi:hypothetical protein
MISGNYIVSRVRLKLGEPDVSKISDLQIYEIATEVQNAILDSVRPEAKFTVALVAGQPIYDVCGAYAVGIQNAVTSWGGQLAFLPVSRWPEVASIAQGNSQFVSGSQGLPVYATLFGEQLYVNPAPTSGSIASPNGAFVEFWAHRIRGLDITGPDDMSFIPQQLERALIYGVCAELNPQYIPLYQEELESHSITPFVKTDSTPIPQW